MEAKGIKESLELIAGLKELGLAGKSVMADGKVDLKDSAVLIGLLPKYQILIDAFAGLGDIPAEAKDLSQEELLMLVGALFAAAKEVKGAA
ncbi:MAG TPA: hypothetical protein VJN02_04000 [Gammaproteobacteria bacterium]|nr:hypothetical protein [Gammaproteobacteria bacterium]